MTNLPNYSLDDLRQAALDLIATNGHTTTLEVKEELRVQGFWAQQQAVSVDMDLLAEGGELMHDDGLTTRTHRIYSLPNPQQLTSDPMPTVVNAVDPVQNPVAQIKTNVSNFLARLRQM